LSRIQADLAAVKLYDTGYLGLLSSQGRWLAHPQPDRVGQSAAELPQAARAALGKGERYRWRSDDGRWMVLAPIQLGETVAPWAVAVSVDADELATDALTVVRNTLITSALGFVAMLALTTWIVRRTLHPLRRMADAMDELSRGQGDLTRRLPVSGHDEISRTAAAFNRFVDCLRDIFAEVKQHSQALDAHLLHLVDNTASVAQTSEQQALAAQRVNSSVADTSASMARIAAAAQSGRDEARRTGDLSGELADLAGACAQAVERAGQLAHGVGGAGDGFGTHHGAPVNLPELLGIKLGQQFFERGADQHFAGGADDAHVLVCRLEVQHLGHGHHHQCAALGSGVAGLDERELGRGWVVACLGCQVCPGLGQQGRKLGQQRGGGGGAGGVGGGKGCGCRV
jgi:HAMP domain-containing protein